MLKKKFEYPKVFDKLDNGNFEKYSNVRYFGITKKTKDEVREQIKVLYYNYSAKAVMKRVALTSPYREAAFGASRQAS